MTKPPNISIVTVCYNHEKYIAETIESVLSQKNVRIEYVVIDDGSTDNSWNIIQRYRKDLSYMERLDGYRKLPTTAINYGFSKTSGDILGWLNSKNILLPKSLYTLNQIFAQFEEVRWLTGLATTINQEGGIVNVRPFYKNIYDFLIGHWSVIQQESTFWRRSLWEQAGPLKELDGWSFDQGLWASFLRHTELYHAQTIFGAYRAIPQAISIQKKDIYLSVTQTIIQALRKDMGKQKKMMMRLYRICHTVKCFLRNVPDTLYIRIPLLNRFHHKTVTYDTMQQTWRIRKKNPFRLFY